MTRATYHAAGTLNLSLILNNEHMAAARADCEAMLARTPKHDPADAQRRVAYLYGWRTRGAK